MDLENYGEVLIRDVGRYFKTELISFFSYLCHSKEEKLEEFTFPRGQQVKLVLETIAFHL